MNYLNLIIFLSSFYAILRVSPCQIDSDCSEYEVCQNLACEHKPLFPNVLPIEIGGIIVLFFSAILTTVAGVGGGVIILPILMLMFNFTTQEAVPNSIAMVFLVLLLRYLLSMSNRHPIRDKSVINYDIALIFSPSIIIGNIFGGLINTASPTWLIMTFIIVLMGFNAAFTGKKALELRNKSISQGSTPKIKLTEIAINYSDELNPEQIKKTSETLDNILKKEKRILDWEKIFLLLLNLGFFVILNLFKGSENVSSIIGIEYCSAAFWVFLFLYIPCGVIFLLLIIWLLTTENKKKIECGYIFLTNDIKWNRKTCIQISFNGILVGLISSLLGVGGAILATPLLLKFGVEAQEASFTASFMALFSSSASTIQYLISGKIRWDYAGFLGMVCIIGMLIGLKVIIAYLKKKNKMYGIVFVLEFIIFLAIALNIYSNTNELINNENSRFFHSIC